MTKETLIVGQFLQQRIEQITKELNRIEKMCSYGKSIKFLGSNEVTEIRLHDDEWIHSMCPKGYDQLCGDLKNATKVYYMLLKEAYQGKLEQLQQMLATLSDNNSGDIAKTFNIDLNK